MRHLQFIFSFCIIFISLDAKIIERNHVNPVILTLFSLFLPIFTPQEQESFTTLNPYDLQHAVERLNKIAQKYFLRPTHLSRLQSPELTEYYITYLFKGRTHNEIEEVCKEIYALFQYGGYIEPMYPTYTTPENILILGASMMVIWKRIAFLNELVQTKKIILSEKTTITICLGERTLMDYEKEDLKKLHAEHNYPFDSTIIDEIEGGKSLIHFFPFCDDIKRESIYLAIGHKKGKATTATTEDNINKFLSLPHHQDGHTLIISGNPYVEYQTEAIRFCFTQHTHCSHLFSLVEGAGFGSQLTPETFSIKDAGVYLDNLARTLYTLTKIYEIVPPTNSTIMKYVYDFVLTISSFFYNVYNYMQ